MTPQEQQKQQPPELPSDGSDGLSRFLSGPRERLRDSWATIGNTEGTTGLTRGTLAEFTETRDLLIPLRGPDVTDEKRTNKGRTTDVSGD